MDLVLHTDASYRNDLDTGKFARMLDDPSQCYKFYWLEAILNLLPTEEGDISFEKCRRDNLNAMWAVENLYIPETPRSSSQISSSITCDRSTTPRSCRAMDCGDIQIMWLSDEQNVENHVALTDEYATDAT